MRKKIVAIIRLNIQDEEKYGLKGPVLSESEWVNGRDWMVFGAASLGIGIVLIKSRNYSGRFCNRVNIQHNNL